METAPARQLRFPIGAGSFTFGGWGLLFFVNSEATHSLSEDLSIWLGKPPILPDWGMTQQCR